MSPCSSRPIVFLLLFIQVIFAAPNRASFPKRDITPTDLTSDILEAGIDQRFAIRAEIKNLPLNEVSLLMNLMGSMYRLSKKPWDGVMTRAERSSLPPWTDSVIAIVPHPVLPSKPFERRYAIWAMYMAMCKVIETGAHATVFTIYWDRALVGTLIIGPSATPGSADWASIFQGSNSTLGIDSVDIVTADPDEGSGQVGDPDKVTISASYNDPGPSIDASKMYGIVGKAMMSACGEIREAQARSQTTSKATWSEWLQIVSRTSSQRVQVVLTNQRLIIALWKLGQWLAATGALREYTAVIKIDDQSKGVLYGSSGPTPGQGSSWDISRVPHDTSSTS